MAKVIQNAQRAKRNSYKSFFFLDGLKMIINLYVSNDLSFLLIVYILRRQ